jgi:hypothetical protein
VTYTCNPSYSGGRDPEDCGLKSSWANSSWEPISKIPNTKRAGGVAQGVGSEFKPHYAKKKKKKKTFLKVQKLAGWQLQDSPLWSQSWVSVAVLGNQILKDSDYSTNSLTLNYCRSLQVCIYLWIFYPPFLKIPKCGWDCYPVRL